MRLFIVGSDKVYAIENFYVKYLRKLGIDVFHFPAQTMFYNYYQKNILHKIIYQVGLSSILKSINKKFRNDVEQFKPDIIWIFKGMEVFPKSLQWAKSRNIKLVNYNGDSPFLFSGNGSGNENVTNSIPLYDLFLTYNKEDKIQMQTQFKIRSEILPFGYDLDDKVFDDCCKLQEIKKVCFLGNPDSFRGKFLNELAMRGIKIDVYGNGWKQYVASPYIKIHNPVYNDEFWKTLRKYRIQLNLMRPHNPYTHNMRTFEAGGVGAIQLAQDTPDHKKYFKEMEEIFLFNNVDSCYDQINKIMNLKEEDALKIRENARCRSVKDGYSYKNRSVQSLRFLQILNFNHEVSNFI
jgi:spore maturation protein CgeB